MLLEEGSRNSLWCRSHEGVNQSLLKLQIHRTVLTGFWTFLCYLGQNWAGASIPIKSVVTLNLSYEDILAFMSGLSNMRPAWPLVPACLRIFVRVRPSSNAELFTLNVTPNLILMIKILYSNGFAFDSAHEYFDVWTRP